MKSKLLLLIFVLAGVMWSLAVTIVATQKGFTLQYLDAPWAGIALGTFGGFMIGALGLRIYAKVSHREALRKIRERLPRQVETIDDYRLDSCQTMYRQPYVGYEAGRVRSAQ